jgi:signal transduction histidine kinase
MVLSLLDLSRIETGQLSIEHGQVDLAALARRLGEEVQPTLERHTLQLDVPAGPVWIEGDALRLEQVLQNLLQNAVKYSPEGGMITLRVEARDQEARLSVTDEGIGIPSVVLPHLFHRFYRAPNADAHQISGIGLGLYVVKEIITLHGGHIDVTSTEGRGSTFTARLPLAAVLAPET